jgi:hypothetical protein
MNGAAIHILILEDIMIAKESSQAFPHQQIIDG